MAVGQDRVLFDRPGQGMEAPEVIDGSTPLTQSIPGQSKELVDLGHVGGETFDRHEESLGLGESLGFERYSRIGQPGAQLCRGRSPDVAHLDIVDVDPVPGPTALVSSFRLRRCPDGLVVVDPLDHHLGSLVVGLVIGHPGRSVIGWRRDAPLLRRSGRCVVAPLATGLSGVRRFSPLSAASLRSRTLARPALRRPAGGATLRRATSTGTRVVSRLRAVFGATGPAAVPATRTRPALGSVGIRI